MTKRKFIVLAHDDEGSKADWVIADNDDWAEYWYERFIENDWAYVAIREVSEPLR
jgi:hypothetical protein